MKVLSLVLSALLATATVWAPSASAETTKEAWVKKKKAEADREADENRNMGGGNAGEAREHNQRVEAKRKARHREIDETAQQLGDGKRNR